MDSKESLNEQLRRATVENMYLNHFNNVLLKQGIITPLQHQQMQAQIAARKPKPPTR